MTELNLNEIRWHHERTLADGDLLTISEHERGLLLAEVERLTAEGVAASERRDYYKARCEQMERDHAETVADRDRARDAAVALEQENAHLREQITNATDAMSDYGRDAVATAGELEDGINADHLMSKAEIDGLNDAVDHLRERLSKATRYEVSPLPEGHDARRHFVLHVVHRGRGTWAVTQPWEPAPCLGADGEWDWEMRPSERTDEWIAAHRFDLDTALRLAEEHAPTLVVNGLTAADVLARDAERGRES